MAMIEHVLILSTTRQLEADETKGKKKSVSRKNVNLILGNAVCLIKLIVNMSRFNIRF